MTADDIQRLEKSVKEKDFEKLTPFTNAPRLEEEADLLPTILRRVSGKSPVWTTTATRMRTTTTVDQLIVDRPEEDRDQAAAVSVIPTDLTVQPETSLEKKMSSRTNLGLRLLRPLFVSFLRQQRVELWELPLPLPPLSPNPRLRRHPGTIMGATMRKVISHPQELAPLPVLAWGWRPKSWLNMATK